MASDEIKFNLNCSGSAKLNSDGSFSYENDCENKLQYKLKPIFEAIAKLGGEEGKIDTAEERNLLKKLQSVFAADGDANVSDEELAMLDSFSSSDDVKAFINKKVAEKSVTPTGLEEENSPLDSQQRPVSDRKAAYNMTITKKRTQELKNAAAALTDAQKQDYTVQRGDGLWKIAYNLLGGSSANPREKDIQTVIAYIAELNDIADVTHPGSKMYVGKTIKVPAAGALENLTISTAPQGGGAITTSAGSGTRGSNVLGRSSIKIKPEPDLNGYTKEELTGEYAGVRKRTKDGAADIFYVSISGLGDDVFVEGSSAEAVKEMKTKIEAEIAKIKGPQEGEDDEAKAKRLDANLKAIKEVAKISGYDQEVVIGLLSTYMGSDKVDVTSNGYNAFIQDLVKTLDPEVIEKILSLGEGQTFDEKFNQQTYNMVCKLYKSILSKERTGAILTENEAKLKEKCHKLTGVFFKVFDGGDYKYDMYYDSLTNSTCYDRMVDDIRTNTPELMDEIVGKLTADGADKTAIYKSYINTTDPLLRQALIKGYDDMGLSKEDVITVINNSGLAEFRTLTIPDDELTNDQKEIFKAAVERIKTVYTELEACDPNNMRYLGWAMKIIDKYAESLPNGDDKDAVEAIKTEILESYFDKTVTGEGGDAVTTYTYKGRRLTKEEAEEFYNNSSLEMDNAIRATVTLDDLGPNGFAQAFEDSDMVPYYEKFVENMTTEQQVLDFIGKVQNSSAIPFDKVLEKFGESEEVMNALTSKCDKDSTISDDNRAKLVDRFFEFNEDGSPKSLDKEALTAAGLDPLNLAKILFPSTSTNFPVKSYLKLIKDAAQNGNSNSVSDYLIEELDDGLNRDGVNKSIYNYDKSGFWSQEEYDKIFEEGTSHNFRGKMLQDGYKNSRYYGVKEGDTWTSILTNWLKTERPKLKEDQIKRYVNRIINDYKLNDVKLEPNKMNEDNSWTIHSVLHSPSTRRVFSGCQKSINVVDFGYFDLNRYDGMRLGAALHADVKGIGSGDAVKHLTDGLDGITINKDTVIGVILGFNNKGNQHIIDYLDDENGSSINRTLMNKIPRALLERAKEAYSDEAAYKNLENYLNKVRDCDNDDFDSHDAARKMDYLMLKLLKSMGYDVSLNEDEKKFEPSKKTKSKKVKNG